MSNANNQKPLTVSEVTVGRILSHYLWNSSAPPKPETMETAATDAARTAVKIDAADYMKNGAGRYVSVADFKMFENFFIKKALLPRSEPYTFDEIGNKIYGKEHFDKLKPDFEKNGFTVAGSQYFTDIDSADFVERAFIFGSTAVTVTPEDLEKLEFVVNKDGSREIRNLRITPKNDNFDFEGGSGSSKFLVDTANALFKYDIDPKGIGKAVPIEYTGTDQLPYITVTAEQFKQLQQQKQQSDLPYTLSEVEKFLAYLLVGAMANRTAPLSPDEAEQLFVKDLPVILDTAGKSSETISAYLAAISNLTEKISDSGVLYKDTWLEFSITPIISPAAQLIDPLVIDLDGDGIETVGLSQNIRFDHHTDGFAVKTGWLGADDGFLALDLNGNGRIDDGSELFGNNTLLADGSLAVHGFEALRQYDSNANGLLDAGDKKWGSFLMWQDKDSDGLSSAGELKRLSQTGIASLDLNYRDSAHTDVHGNVLRQNASAKWADGKTTAAADVWFRVDKAQTAYSAKFKHTGEIKALPEVLAFGKVYHLRDAMAQDKVLLGRVKAYAAAENPDRAQIEALIYRWTGVEKTAAGSRGEYIDARRLAALEKLAGEEFRQSTNGSANPRQDSAKLLNAEFDRFADYVAATVKLQKIYASAVGGNMFTADAAGKPTADFEGIRSHIFKQIAAKNLADAAEAAQTAADALVYNPVAADGFRQSAAKFTQLVFFNASEADLQLLAQLGGTAGDAGNNRIDAGAERNILLEGSVLSGREGNDDLRGLNTDDILIGGTGNDYLQGNSGSDTYVFGKGFGRDNVYNNDLSSGIDTLRFTGGQKPQDFVFRRDMDDLLIEAKNGSDRVKIDRHFVKDYQIDRIEFDGYGVLTPEDVKGRVLQATDKDETLWAYNEGSKISALGGNDTVYGADGDDVFDGGAGNDNLRGGKGNDTLIGGAGNDYLEGNGGSDTYVFGKGFGRDNVYNHDLSAGVDTLRFTGGQKPQDFVFRREMNDLLIETKNGSDRLKIDRHFVKDYQIDRIEFDGYGVLTPEDVKGRVLQATDKDETLWAYNEGSKISALGGNDTVFGADGNDVIDGGAGNDNLRGGKGNDTLIGGTGNDYLVGGSGRDTYVFAKGHGQDVVDNLDIGQSMDTVRFTDVKSSEVKFRKSGNDLLLSGYSDGDSVELDSFFNSSYTLERFEFSDRTIVNPDFSKYTGSTNIAMSVFEHNAANNIM